MGTNFLLSVTDNIGRKVAYTYDSADRITGVTRLAGTAEAVTTNYGYSQACECDDVTSTTDPLNQTSIFDYDSKHNLIAATNPLGNAVTFTYNAGGQPLSAKDALNNVTQLTYENGDLVAVTDPRGQTGSGFLDSAGRLVSSRNPLGQASRFEYDALNRPIKLVDALGGMTEFTYDANGNLLTVKDARENGTSYTYDNLNRLTSRTDPLQRVETYEYDESSKLQKFTDRRGMVTSFVYDSLYRVTLVGFGRTGPPENPSFESTITYTYDSAGRLTELLDSSPGSITYNYDNFDRVTSITTPQGSISYSYDGAGRRTSMTVAGQPTVNYVYDNANRVLQITQGANSVGFSYDNAGRPISLSRSNGILVEYTYDQASTLTSITYKKDGSVVGNIAYEHDATGKRTRIGGSLARTALPQALTSVTYGAANRLTERSGATFTYDENGNLTSDGANTYSWNARNQLVSMSGPGLTASFAYDATGNRINKTINGASTSYLYDGANVVQELVGTTTTANILNGGVDKVLSRTDANGTRTPLIDGLGSTLGLLDDAGTVQTQYTYDPFGNTTSTGRTSTNRSKYTGREEDETGLYYYRARYYAPSLQRFISEDPAGFDGGDVNLYAYVKNDPVNSVDPSGLCGVFSLQQDGDSEPLVKFLPAVGSYDSSDEQLIRQTLQSLAESSSCAEAFKRAGLEPIQALILHGIVIGPATLLLRSANREMMGITEFARRRDVDAVGSTEIQAFTVRNVPGFAPDTTDTRARIFLNASAFRGGSLPLRQVLAHEFIHVAGVIGYPPTFIGRLLGRDDLTYYKYYEEIMASCR